MNESMNLSLNEYVDLILYYHLCLMAMWLLKKNYNLKCVGSWTGLKSAMAE